MDVVQKNIPGDRGASVFVLDRKLIHGNKLILYVFLIYAVCAAFFFLYNDLHYYARFLIYKIPYLIAFAGVLVVKSLSYVISHKMTYGYYLDRKKILPDLKESWLNISVIYTVFMPFLGISFIMSIFASIKTLFPMVNPFYLDVALGELDQALHFGSHAWELTHAVFGSVLATRVMDFMYQIWFGILLIFPVWMVVSYRLGNIRTKFLLAYILTWSLLGTFFAVASSSVGPVFYGNFVDGANIYAPLMDRLHEISGVIKGDDGAVGLYSILAQKILWSYYTNDYVVLGSGISAMPSMHVSFAALVYLTVGEMNRKAGYVALLYLIFIQIGSVHLGWHYAVDGYLSILLTWAIWKFSGWLVGRVCGAEKSLNPDNPDQYPQQARIG